jgi:ectoine hydroxylase-related dioxygenase (phytanoyl-CoA dioxygenase family)
MLSSCLHRVITAVVSDFRIRNLWLNGLTRISGANTTSGEERLLFSCFMTRGWLRQEENQYLTVPQETMRKLPVATQKVAGYSISEPFLGWVEAADPRAVLDPSILVRSLHKSIVLCAYYNLS